MLRRYSEEGRALWDAWDRRWMLIQAQELSMYAMCSDDTDYLAHSNAVFIRAMVDYRAVRLFRQRLGRTAVPPRRASGGFLASASQGRPPQREVRGPPAPPASQPVPVPRPPQAAAHQAAPAPRSRSNGAAPRRPPTEAQRARRRRYRQRRKERLGKQAAEVADARMEEDDVVAEVPSLAAIAESRGASSSSAPVGPSVGALVVAVRQRSRRASPVGFRPVQPAGQVQVRSSRQEGEKNARAISPSATIAGGKSSRGRDTPCVTPAAERGEEQLGALSGALLVPLPPSLTSTLSQYLELGNPDRLRFWRTATEMSKKIVVEALEHRGLLDSVYEEALDYDAGMFGLGRLKETASQSIRQVPSEPLSHRPFTRFDLARLTAEPEDHRSFWLRAHVSKKKEIAEALSSLRERDDVVQEARLEFGAEEWA